MPSRVVPPDSAAYLKAAAAALTRTPDWTAQAACAQLRIDPRAYDLDWTDPHRNGHRKGHITNAEQDRRDELAEAARTICTSYCPVQVECMAAGSINREWGLWGGIERETIPGSGAGRTKHARKKPTAA